MGCGASSQLALQHQALTKQLQETIKEKDSICEDRVTLEREVKQLRSHVSEIISENELLKQRADKVASNGRPETFEATQGEDDVIANWIEMDLRDGDRLLAALATVHPASEGEINAMLGMSDSLRQTESSLQAYCNYFSTRFGLYNQIWAKAVGIQFALDESFKRNKESIAAACQSVEPMLGKKSQAMEDLRTEVRNLFTLENADFMDELRRLEAKIAGIRADNFNKRMEEKEAEKQRIIGKYDTEIKNLKAKHAADMTEKSQEMEQMRISLQETIDKNEANYQHSFKVMTDTRNKEKRLIRTSFHDRNLRLKEETLTELTAHKKQLQEVTLQLKQFCDQTTAEKNRIIRNFQQEIKELKEKFAFDSAESKSEANNNFRLLLEDCRVEIAKRDKELADFKAFHIGQKAQMRHLTSTWNAQIKSDVLRLASDFQAFERNLQTQVIGKLRSDHETFIQSLRDEFRATINMLKEDHVQEIKKRDEKEAALIKDYEYRLLDRQYQLQHTIGIMQEDCRVEIAKRDKELADFKAFHIGQKAQMRHLTSTWNSLVKSDFVRLASDFQVFEQKVQTQVIGKLRSDHETFIQSLRDESKSTINMLKEDHLQEIKKRDEKEAALIKDYEYRLQDLRNQLQHTIGAMQEDCRVEIAKRDKELADFKAFHIGQKAQMRHLTCTWNAQIKSDFLRLASDFQAFERNLQTQVIGKLRSDHETFIQSLRDEFRATINMLKEDHVQEIKKRDEKEAALIKDYEYRLLDRQYQLQHTIGIMQEDVRFLVQKRDHEYDECERRQAIELTSLVQTYMQGIEDAFAKEQKSATETLSSLSTYHLDIPVPPVTQTFASKITVMESESGAKTYTNTLVKLKSVLTDSVRNTEAKVQSKQTQVQSLVQNWLDVEQKREHLDAKLQADTESYTTKIQGLEGKLSTFGNYSSQKIEDLEKSVVEKEAEIKDKENTIEFLNQEVSERFREISERDSSIESLKVQVSTFKEEIVTLEEARTTLGSQVEELNQVVAEKQQAFEDVKKTMMSSAGMFQESQKFKSMKRLFTDFRANLANLKRGFLIRWRLKVAPAAPSDVPPPIADEEDEEEVDRGDLEDAEEILMEEKRLALENNVLIEAFRKAGKPEKPLTVVQVMKFFEEMMDRKYDADLGDIKNQRPLRALPDFMLEHLNRTFGLKKLAIKMLCQIIPTLEEMYNEQHPYAMLFCRLVQVFHPDPVPFQLGVFLTKIRVEFTGYTERYQKEKEARDSKRGKKDSGKGKDKGANAQTGGEAYLVDIIAYVYTLFENDRRSGELMLKFLKPEAVEMTDYIMFKLCHKMAKLGLNSEGIFNMLDKDGGGSLGEVEFVRGARRNLELWISPEDISLVFRSITNNAREMTKDAFVGRVNFKAYLENCRSDMYVVTRSNFLTSLIEVYHAKQRRNAAFIKGLLPNRKLLAAEDFEGMVRRIDPSIDSEQLTVLYEEALKYTAEPEQGATPNASVRALLRYPVGRLRQSAFGNV